MTPKRQLYIRDIDGNVTRTWMKDGKPGNFQTMLAMRDLLRQKVFGLDGGVVNEELLRILYAILGAGKATSHQPRRIIRAIHKFITSQILYVNDIGGGNESIETPMYTLHAGVADCDGLVVLECALLGLAGISIGFEAARYDADYPEGYQHVYLYALVPNARGDGKTLKIFLDPTAAKRPPGWKQPGALETAQLNVFDDTGEELAGIGSFFKNIGKTIAPIAAGFIPGAGAFLAPVVGAAIGGLEQNAAKKQAEREASAQFDKLALEANTLFHDAQTKPVVTVDDGNRAHAAYDQLATIAAQVPSIGAVWNSAAYKPAYDNGLRIIDDKIRAQLAKQQPATTSGGFIATLTGGNNSTGEATNFAPLLIGGGLAFVAFAVLIKR